MAAPMKQGDTFVGGEEVTPKIKFLEGGRGRGAFVVVAMHHGGGVAALARRRWTPARSSRHTAASALSSLSKRPANRSRSCFKS